MKFANLLYTTIIMNLKYGENTFFLGVVKFFDEFKEFGFIASNNCNMPSPKYNQDFYVNSESFIEDDAKIEGKVVVFQVENQKNGRIRAVNVRKITRSEDDISLVLSYYGEHEYVKINDDKQINLFDHAYRPRKLVAEKVKAIIVNDKERSPETTFKHVDFFLKHYKVGISTKEMFVFDRDYEKEEKQIWVDFFEIFTDEEWFEILKAYPTACRYVTDESILEQWVDSLELGKTEEYLSRIKDGRRSFYSHRVERYFPGLKNHEAIVKLLPEGPKEKYLAKVQQLADEIASGIIKMKTEGYPNQALLQEILIWVLKLTPNKHEDELKKVKNIRAYKDFRASVLSYLDNPIDYLKEFSLSPRNYSEGRAYIRDYENARFKSNELKKTISRYFEGLDTSEWAEVIEKVCPDITASLDKYFDEGNLQAIVGAFMFFVFLGEDFKQTYLERLYPLVKEKLIGDVQNSINEKKGLPDLFMNSYRLLTSQFDEETKKLLHDDVLAVMRTANNIELIFNCSAGRNKEWLTTEEAHQLAEAVLKEWKYEDYSNFFNNNFNNKYLSTPLFSGTEDLCVLIANYAFNLIKPFSLSDFFDGSPAKVAERKIQTPWGVISLNERSAETENIKFLEYLMKLLPKEKKHPLWQTYINERSKTDLLVLYDKGLVETLPLNILEDVVNEITLDNVLADKERWYTRPILPDGPIKKILTNADDSLFTAIAKRLTTLSSTGSDISLAVLLIELMKINKPKDMKDWEERDWDREFAQKIKAFRATLPNDSKLAVLLMVVHFQSSGSMALLPDIYFLLPPYVQIRVVKRLFNVIATGKISRTADGLYEMIGGDKHQICFPLEIVFAYLKLREKDPTAELNNNLMLQLLDGREDHGEWIGIRQFLKNCNGRVYTQNILGKQSSWRGDFYNGYISQGNNGKIIVYVPNKMINDNNELQQYNNKYFATVNELISITFTISEYTKKETSSGVFYTFDESKEMELYTLSRYYNFRYKGVNKNFGFQIKDVEDVFCECRMSDKVDNYNGIPFYWCANKPCFCHPIRYHLSSEWESYTLLDFMRILDIPVDYTNRYGKSVRFGYFIIVSGYFKSFAKFYEHLKCRHCGKIMRPASISNFASRAVNEFSCSNPECKEHGNIIYLNHCFNKPKCNSTIDSRDSMTCPNGQYICPECGGCCSTENFRNRLSYLNMTGGIKSTWLINFVEHNLGHWEKGERFCFKCGNPMQNYGGVYKCEKCGTKY